MSETSGLPSQWSLAQLGDLFTVLDSQRIPVNQAQRTNRPGNVPYYGATGQVGWINDHLFDEELLLLGEDGAPFLQGKRPKAYMIKGKSWVNNHAHVLRSLGDTPSLFWKHQLDQVDYHDYVTGTTRLKLPQAPMRRIPLLVPPLPEQWRIVDALESYLTRLDDAVATLERVQRNLRRYRASVLKAAVEGRLVPTGAEPARAADRDYEPASALLERILVERRRRWEQSVRRGKYQEPAAPDISGLSSLPDGWCWVRAEQICEFITKGTTPQGHLMSQGSGEVPYIKVYNLTFDGSLDFSIDPTFVSHKTHTGTLARSVVYPGDVLINIVGPPLGKVSIVPKTYPEWNINQAIARYRPVSGILNRYLAIYLSSSLFFNWARSRSKATAGQFNLTLEICRDAPVPLPPACEQVLIVAEAERLFSLHQATDVIAMQSRRRTERLRQAILRWAFEGKLSDQDPGDEPASVLLERIKAERDAAIATQKTSSRPKGRVARKTA